MRPVPVSIAKLRPMDGNAIQKRSNEGNNYRVMISACREERSARATVDFP